MRKLITLLTVLFGTMGISNAQETPSGMEKTAAISRAKHSNLEIGLMGGAIVYTGDAHCEKFLFKNGLSPAGGAFLRYYLTDRFSLRANFLTGKIKGDDKNYPGTEHGSRNFKFSAPIYDFNVALNFEPWGHKRYTSGAFRRIFSPYVSIGAGFVSAKPTTDYNEINNTTLRPLIEADKTNNKFTHFSIPLGVGWRYDLSEHLTVGLEASYRVPFTDYLDGISKSGNPDAKDWYETGTLNIGYRLKYKRDADKDGIADEDDACPTEKGTLRGKGCPDQDGDGVVDKMDTCPTEQGSPALNGCPDKDSDGIADRDDACPDYAGDVANGGCPDKDGDGIIDMKDDCPDTKGLVAFGGCPDTDADGIPDKSDTCPTEKGTKADRGCPATDTDKDGIADRDDKCPEQAGTRANEGCPEVEKVAEVVTNSPVPTPIVAASTTAINSTVSVGSDAVVVGTYTDYSSAENLGAGSTYKGNGREIDPRSVISSTVNVGRETAVISSEETAVFDEALYGIQFETGSAVISSSSNSVLTKVYNVMNNKRNVNFEIGGYTDNVGSSAANQRLSEARAKAVYNYLTKRGIAASRLTFVGYGGNNPLEDNGTAAGRAKNRRVQFAVK